jgi:hypothetical protein
MYSCTHYSSKIPKTDKTQKHPTIKGYVESVDHLTEDQKKAMLNEQPFIGMTSDEAAMAMNFQNALVTLDGNILYGIYLDSDNTKYHVYFSGIIPEVSFWSVFEFKDIELVDIENVHPDSGLPDF